MTRLSCSLKSFSKGIIKLDHPCIHVDFPVVICEVWHRRMSLILQKFRPPLISFQLLNPGHACCVASPCGREGSMRVVWNLSQKTARYSGCLPVKRPRMSWLYSFSCNPPHVRLLRAVRPRHRYGFCMSVCLFVWTDIYGHRSREYRSTSWKDPGGETNVNFETFWILMWRRKFILDFVSSSRRPRKYQFIYECFNGQALLMLYRLPGCCSYR